MHMAEYKPFMKASIPDPTPPIILQIAQCSVGKSHCQYTYCKGAPQTPLLPLLLPTATGCPLVMQQPTLTRTTKLKKQVKHTGIRSSMLRGAATSHVAVRLWWQWQTQSDGVLWRLWCTGANWWAVSVADVDLRNGPKAIPMPATSRWSARSIEGF